MAGENFIALESTSQEIKTAVEGVKTDVAGVKTDTTQILAKLKALASVDLIFYKTTSPEFTGIIEKISLTNLPHLPFIIAIVRGSMDTIPSNLWTSDKQCALYGRFDAVGYSYFGLYSENRDYLLNQDAMIKYTKNPNGTYDLNDIPVFSWYVSGNFGGNDYTAILIGKGEE